MPSTRRFQEAEVKLLKHSEPARGPSQLRCRQRSWLSCGENKALPVGRCMLSFNDEKSGM